MSGFPEFLPAGRMVESRVLEVITYKIQYIPLVFFM